MYASQRSNKSPSVFVAAKAATAIPVAHELVRDALIQAALDPEIRAIEFIPTIAAYGEVIALDVIVLRGDDGSQVLDIAETRPVRSLDDEALALLAIDQLGLQTKTLSAVDIGRQPRAANSRLVWACRHYRVSAGDRVRVLQVLTEEGEMTLARAAAQCRFAVDAVAAVLALVCADLIEADLATLPLGPETRLRRRSTEGETHGH
jgi:hypothetical protein